jgi:DNA-binding NarL/FixJ family response regulator
MPNLNGLQAAKQIHDVIPETALVILSSHADESFAREAKKAGAGCYVNKSRAGDSLVKRFKQLSKEDFIVLD